jgi:anaerobic dimethyl sulfoxide reductase subunit C (anchor subunit)
MTNTPPMPGKMIHSMNKSEEYGTLALFTTLAPLSVGGLLGLLIVQRPRIASSIDSAAIVILALGLLALIVSLLHLGRPWRAPLAVFHLATSWLSREVVLFGLFLFLLACYAILPITNMSGVVRDLTGWAAVLIGLVATVATGQTYRLHARPIWDHWLTTLTFPLSALSSGLLFGLFIASRFASYSAVTGYLWLVMAILLVTSLVVTSLRSIGPRPASVEAQISRRLALRSFLWLLVVRVIAICTALLMIGIGNGIQFLAWIPALIGEFGDRLVFFKTVVPVTLRARYL